MKRCEKVMLWTAVGVVLTSSSSLAYDWAGITSGGVATIPSGITATIATDEDVSAVTALKGIVFADATASVSYTAKTALDLRAAVSGAGTFAAASSGKLVLWGDNSALASPGHFAFDNSPVVVSNHFGLGSSASGAAVITWNTSSSLNFGSPTGAFTNEVALSFTSASGWPVIGSSSTDETFVQSNDCYVSNQNGCLKFKNNCEFIAGKVYDRTGFFYNERSGDNVNVRYTGTSQLYVPEWLWLNGNATTTFTFGPEAHGSSPRVIVGQGGAPVVVFAIENYFDTSRNPCLSFCKGAVYDLNGYGQQFAEMDNQYFGATINADNTAYVTIRSATPAALTTTNCSDGRDYALLFEGKAGFCHDVARTNGLANVLSTSRGLLDVAQGRVVLKWNAGWSGDATVRAGAELEVASPRGFAGGLGKLSVETGGKLILGESAGVTVCELKFGSTVIDQPGKYSVAALKAAGHPVEGPDELELTVVESFDDPWEGWPTTPGATAKVPRATTVYITDADVAKVAALSAIKIGPQARVVCSNETQNLVLTARVSGYGTFEAIDSAGLELAGDNSGLQSPGAFVFRRSPVTVSHRRGLGGSDTDEMNFYYGTDPAALKFRGNGLTNDVPLRLHVSALKATEVVLGGENVTDVFVQNASLLLDDPADGRARRINFSSETHLTAGTFVSEKRTDVFAYVGSTTDGVHIYLENEVLVRAELFFQTGGTLHLACAMDVVSFAPYSGRQTVCESAATCGFARYVPMASMSVVDLNGHDQIFQTIADNYDSGHLGSIVTSAVPATVTITAVDSNRSAYGIRFRGEAGLVFDVASGENTVENLVSDTLAPLVVSRGTFGFAKGAGWGGTNVTVRSGATLKIASDATETAFAGPDGTRSRTDLFVEAGGTLNLVGGTVPVATLTYGGHALPAGTYGSGDGVGIVGAGRLQVRKLRNAGLVIIVR